MEKKERVTYAYAMDQFSYACLLIPDRKLQRLRGFRKRKQCGKMTTERAITMPTMKPGKCNIVLYCTHTWYTYIIYIGTYVWIHVHELA